MSTKRERARRFDPVGAAFVLGFPVLAAIVTLALTAAWSDRLPARIATHWSGGSAPDGYSSLWSSAWVIAALIVVVGGGVGVVGAFAQAQLVLRRTMIAVSGLVTGLIATVDIVLLAGQLDLADPSDARLHAWSIGLGALVGLIVGVVGAALLRDHRVRVAATGVPEPELPRADPLDLPVTAVVGIGVRLAAALYGALGVIAVVTCILAGSPWPLPLFAAVALLIAVMTRFHIVLDEDGLRVLAAGVVMIEYGSEEFTEARVRTVNPLAEFGGWGLRARSGRRYGVVTRHGPGFTVLMAGGDRLTVTTERADEFAAAVNTLADRRRPGPGPGAAEQGDARQGGVGQGGIG